MPTKSQNPPPDCPNYQIAQSLHNAQTAQNPRFAQNAQPASFARRPSPPRQPRIPILPMLSCGVWVGIWRFARPSVQWGCLGLYPYIRGPCMLHIVRLPVIAEGTVWEPYYLPTAIKYLFIVPPNGTVNGAKQITSRLFYSKSRGINQYLFMYAGAYYYY